MTGRELYERWIALEDRPKWAAPSVPKAEDGVYEWLDDWERVRWERLAAELTAERAEAASSAVHWVANEITDAWERREGRRASA